MKNLAAKTRRSEDAYEYWSTGQWLWAVLKKWQVDDNKPYARWFCKVYTPIVPEGEMGDVYVTEITQNAERVSKPEAMVVLARLGSRW
jgi:hypothetical protein